MSNNWTDQDGKAPTSIVEEPYQIPPYPKTDRELRIAKHVARLQSADEMLADKQISQVERDNIRTRMLQVIEVPGA